MQERTLSEAALDGQSEVEPALSVIVPVYDQAAVIAENVRTIRERVAAGFDQPFVVIVVSDGSVDGTAERMLESELPGVQVLYYRPQPRPGIRGQERRPRGPRPLGGLRLRPRMLSRSGWGRVGRIHLAGRPRAGLRDDAGVSGGGRPLLPADSRERGFAVGGAEGRRAYRTTIVAAACTHSAQKQLGPIVKSNRVRSLPPGSRTPSHVSGTETGLTLGRNPQCSGARPGR